jgi:hypothetical protein
MMLILLTLCSAISWTVNGWTGWACGGVTWAVALVTLSWAEMAAWTASASGAACNMAVISWSVDSA